MWLTIGYRIEKKSIPLTLSQSEERYFLDAEQVPYADRHKANAIKSLSNITSGTYSHCVQERNARLDAVRFRNIAERELKSWSLFGDEFLVFAYSIRGSDGRIYATWIDLDHETAVGKLDQPRCGFGIQIEQDVCYLQTIGLWPEYQRQGHGDSLYKRVVAIAKACDCKVVIQYPSGKTGRGETRASYLLRRGWLPAGEEVYMDIEPGFGAQHFKLKDKEFTS